MPRPRRHARVQPRVARARVVPRRSPPGGDGRDAPRAHHRRARRARRGVRAVRALTLAMLLAAAPATAGAPARFFVMGDGTISLVNEHTGERAQVRYRR